jgi:hypothetical protein
MADLRIRSFPVSMTGRLRAALLLPLLLAALVSAGCSSASVVRDLKGSRTAIDDRLYFGRSIPGGGLVSDSAWAGFLRDIVTPRFPAGLTAWRAQGQWRGDSGGIVHEESFVVELIHDDDAAVDAAIDAIIESYRGAFDQEAVMLVRTPARVRF